LIPDIATAGLPTVAVRFPDHPVAREIISLSTGAIAAPSANPFGYLSPTRAEHVREMLGDKTDIILDGGPARIGVESTVLNLCSEDIQILRYGGTPKEKIEELIGPTMGISCEMDESAGLVSPGRLKSHYAPRKALLVFSREAIISQSAKADCAFLFFDGPSRDAWLAAQVGAGVPEKTVVRVLSEYGDILEAAARLFEILHELDRYPAVPDNGFSRILAQLAPEKGLGAAINDRLRRAGGV
jgi:L-threonylcarbamoyladenylate synthase